MMLKVENANQVHYSSYSNISTVSPDQINTRIKRDSNRSATAFKFTLSVDPDMDFGSCLTVMGSPQLPGRVPEKLHSQNWMRWRQVLLKFIFEFPAAFTF